MSPGEYKVLRKTLGMTSEWVAKQCGVNLRTAQRWEASITPPRDAIELLEFWAKRFRQYLEMVERNLNTLTEEHGEPRAVNLTRYRTDESLRVAHPGAWINSMHDAAIGHIALSLQERYTINIVDWHGDSPRRKTPNARRKTI